MWKGDEWVVQNKRENTAPFDAQGGASYPASEDLYNISVESEGQILSIDFTVGTITPPPTREPITESYIENGKAYYITGQGTYYNGVTKL